jgi:hypothetical protein
MRPLHFGHSIDPSQVSALTAVGVTKQNLHHIVGVRNFNDLAITYLPQGIRLTGLVGTKTSGLSFFCAGVGDS